MNPTFKEGDVVLVDKIFWRLKKLNENSIIVFNHQGTYSVKRTVFVEKQAIKMNDYYTLLHHQTPLHLNPQLHWCIQNGYLYIPKDNYFALGDNLSFSIDSRKYGLVTKKDITGLVLGVLYHEAPL